MTDEIADTTDLTILDRLGAPYRHFDRGQKIFLEHQPGDTMFMVRSGRVDLIHYGTVLENVRPGGVFGEMALIDGGERSAAALAAEKTEVIVIDRPTFLSLVQQNPEFALKLLAVQSERIRRMNRQI